MYTKKTKVFYNPQDIFPEPVQQFVMNAVESGITNGEYLITIISSNEFYIERVWVDQMAAESYINFIIDNRNTHELGPVKYEILDN